MKEELGMEMIDRYIYAVIQRLPASQRMDIEKEIRGLIQDMLEEKSGEKAETNKNVEAVLIELGSPKELADKYRGGKRYIIGPELYDKYWSVLKIVLVAVTIAMTVVNIIQLIMNPENILQIFIELITTTISAGIQGFAWVTVIFMVMEYNWVNKSELSEGVEVEWDPADLPELPDSNLRIKQSEPVIGIILSILFLSFLVSSSENIGVYFFQDESALAIVPVFNKEGISAILPFIYLFVGIGILKECVKFVVKKWTKRLAIFNTIINVISFIIIAFILAQPMLWNMEFTTMMVQKGAFVEGSEAFQTISTIWRLMTEGLVLIVGIVYVIDTIVPIYKTFFQRHNALNAHNLGK
jgi:hypothetical protein